MFGFGMQELLVILAIVLFAVGFYFQAIADYQLERFRKTRHSPDEILDHGLWALSRHNSQYISSMNGLSKYLDFSSSS